jgi:hypothetical protein
MNNLRQLQVAWFMYVLDNHDRLPGVRGGGYASSDTWVSGWLDFAGRDAGAPGVHGKPLFLTDPHTHEPTGCSLPDRQPITSEITSDGRWSSLSRGRGPGWAA